MARHLLTFLLMFFGTMPLTAFAANCGKEFNGVWVVAERYHRNQYGYTKFEYLYVPEAKKIVTLDFESSTSRGGYPLGSDMPGSTGVRFIHFNFSDYDGNISARLLDSGKCELSFGQPEVLVDKFNEAHRNIAKKAQLTVNGSTLRLCWGEPGHMTGDCKTFQLKHGF